MSFAGPVSVDVLAKFIDKGQKSFGIDNFHQATGTDIPDLKYVINMGLGDKYEQLGNILGIDLVGIGRCTAHANEFERLRKPPWSRQHSYN